MFTFLKSQERRLKDALSALQASDIKGGMAALHKLGEEQYPEAEYTLADIHEFILKDMPKAAMWYKRAAEHGHVKAQWCLANLYMAGKGIEAKPAEAIRLYRAAAAKGVVEAQFVLGEVYRGGHLVPKDPATALAWYQQAAKGGYDHAATRIQQFWKDGVFQDSKSDGLGTNQTPSAQRPVAQRHELVAPLLEEIVKDGQRRGYIPASGVPFVPELQGRQTKVVEFICSFINDEMKSDGLDEARMAAVFRFVFARGFEAIYLWHKSSDGKIDDMLRVFGNPFDDEQYLTLPDDVRSRIEEIDAPEVICRISMKWWDERKDQLRAQGVDVWPSLALALSTTFATAVSIGLKMFGYRKD